MLFLGCAELEFERRRVGAEAVAEEEGVTLTVGRGEAREITDEKYASQHLIILDDGGRNVRESF